MDDNSAILELITEFLVSKNLLHTAQTLQHEWVGLYPGHAFPTINNLMENASTAIPVDPVPTSGPYFFQSNHHANVPRGGEMEEEDDGMDGDGMHPDEPMNEDEEEEGEEGEVGEEEEEEGEANPAGEKGEGEGAEEDSASVDSAYDRVLVEDISEIMDEIAVDEEDMGEIDPLANEASPSDESESGMEEGENDAGEDEVEFDEEEGEGEGDERETGEPEDEEEEEEEESEDREEDEEGEEEEEEESEDREQSEVGEGERDKSVHSPTRGVIESVTELLGQHIQNQRDEFYQEDEGKTEADKDLAAIELAKLHLGDANQDNATDNQPPKNQNENKLVVQTTNLTPRDSTHDDAHQPELGGYECDVQIVNYENKKSGAMFSPLISPTPHSPTPALSPGIIPSIRPGGGGGDGAPSPSGAPTLTHSRSALFKRDASSPLGKKHVQITSDSAPTSRSSSNLSARHNSPPPSSPTLTRVRSSNSTPSSPTSASTPTTNPILKPTPPTVHTPYIPSRQLGTPTTPPPAYSLDPPEFTPTPNGITKPSIEPNAVVTSTAAPVPVPGAGTGTAPATTATETTENANTTKTDRRQSLDGRDVVMRDILSPRTVDEKAPFVYPVQVDGTTYDCFNLKIVHVKNRTGFESTKDFPIKPNTLVAGRYQILEFLDSAAFSKAVRALDLHTGGEVCMKIIKNNKDYVDQSLDEIKLLKYLNSMGDPHKYNILQLYDFFYYKEHLFIVTELLRENLYEFYKFTNENGHPPYFTIPRLQRVAQQCLAALEFIHGLDIIHTDLKPENILIKSYSRCEIKIIDFGSSCFTRDHLGSYVQSRDYRAIEVILGLPYSAKIDIWSLGCILAELFTGKVLFVNRSLATLLARVSALVGPIPQDMIAKGRFSHKFFTKYHSLLYERDEKTGQYFFLQPKRIQLKDWLKTDDQDFVDFIQTLLALRPDDRPTASGALQHKWLHKSYPAIN